MRDDRVDPLPAFRFRVEIDGITLAAFRECRGLAAETEVFEIREGGVNHETHKRPGHSSSRPLHLLRGVATTFDLWQWHRDVVEGRPGHRRSGDIVLCEDGGRPQIRWTFLNGWPCRWEGPVLLTGEPSMVVEAVQIVHEGIRLNR
jgi:phage tail-like protein